MPFSLKLAVHRPRWQGNVVCRDATATRKPRDTLPTGAEGGPRSGGRGDERDVANSSLFFQTCLFIPYCKCCVSNLDRYSFYKRKALASIKQKNCFIDARVL